MRNFIKSKGVAWGAFLLIIIIIALTFTYRKPAWWMFIDVFFAFMAAFCNLMSLYIRKLNVTASNRLNTAAMVMVVLTLLALIGEWIAFQFIFS